LSEVAVDGGTHHTDVFGCRVDSGHGGGRSGTGGGLRHDGGGGVVFHRRRRLSAAPPLLMRACIGRRKCTACK